MNRRKLLEAIATVGAAGATASFPSSLEAQGQLSFRESSLTPEDIERHKELSTARLEQSIPQSPNLAYLHEHVRYLKDESQMYIPDQAERTLVIRKSVEHHTSSLTELARNLRAGETGLYLFADIDDENRHFQRMYVIKKDSEHVVRFEKAYHVSIAENGFGDERGSNKTPLGLRRIMSGEVGAFGEVVRAERNTDDTRVRSHVHGILNQYFTKLVTAGVPRWFARTIGEIPFVHPDGVDRGEVVTARYAIDEPRGIHIHGTNRSGKWEERTRRWTSYLGGRRRSTGCIRMSNTDVYDLGLSGYAKIPSPGAKGHTLGTVVMVHATQKAREQHASARNEYGTDIPRRRLLPGDPGYEEQVRREELKRGPPPQNQLPVQAAPPQAVPSPKRFTPPPRRKLPEDL